MTTTTAVQPERTDFYGLLDLLAKGDRELLETVCGRRNPA